MNWIFYTNKNRTLWLLVILRRVVFTIQLTSIQEFLDFWFFCVFVYKYVRTKSLLTISRAFCLFERQRHFFFRTCIKCERSWGVLIFPFNSTYCASPRFILCSFFSFVAKLSFSSYSLYRMCVWCSNTYTHRHPFFSLFLFFVFVSLFGTFFVPFLNILSNTLLLKHLQVSFCSFRSSHSLSAMPYNYRTSLAHRTHSHIQST